MLIGITICCGPRHINGYIRSRDGDGLTRAGRSREGRVFRGEGHGAISNDSGGRTLYRGYGAEVEVFGHDTFTSNVCYSASTIVGCVGRDAVDGIFLAISLIYSRYRFSRGREVGTGEVLHIEYCFFPYPVEIDVPRSSGGDTLAGGGGGGDKGAHGWGVALFVGNSGGAIGEGPAEEVITF